MSFSELRFSDWIRQQATSGRGLVLGPGDDMAILELDGSRALIASDQLLDGVHFDTGEHSLELIGRKAVARNLSDCAAMAVQPVAVTCSISLPTSFDESSAQALFRGMSDIAKEFGVAIAGGDTARWAHPLAINVSILAIPYPNVKPVLRSGAVAEDVIYVGGLLGGSRLGRHMTFTPRVEQAHDLASQLGEHLHAMIDISDGLALDLHRLCKASDLGAELYEEAVLAMAHLDAERAATDGTSVLNHVLGDGEDHELLFTADPDVPVPESVHRIGRITAEKELVLRHTDGSIKQLQALGFEHR